MENADLVKMMFQCFLSVYSDEIVMTNFTKSLCKISIPVTLQCMLGMLFVGLIMSSRYGAKVRAFKQRIFMKNNM